MAMNLKALREVQAAQKRGNNLFMQASKEVGENTIVRLVPTRAELNNLFYFKQSVYWFNKKLLVSPSTFGEHCIIDEYLDSIHKDILDSERDGNLDTELKTLYDKAKGKKSSYLIPVLHLENIEYDGPKIVNFTVVGDGVRILQCGQKLQEAINEVILSPALERRLEGVPDFIADRIKGYNISLRKTGEVYSTKYSAKLDETCEIPAKYYEKVPSLINITKKQVYTDEYIKAVLDSYFYGDPFPSDDRKVSRYADTNSNSGDAGTTTRQRARTNHVGTTEDVETVEREQPRKRTSSRTTTIETDVVEAPAKKVSKRNLVDDMEDLDD